MRVQPIPPNSPCFGYSNQLKTLYKKGKLPIKYGFYGDVLTLSNVSLEHLKPHSKGGKTCLSNLVLATKENNNLRGDMPLVGFAARENVEKYLDQFKGVRVKDFNGDMYIKMIRKTLKDLL
jgi:hypothetical protein